MKHLFTLSLALLPFLLWANDKDSTINYSLPDTTRAVQFLAEINIHKTTGKREVHAGIRTDVVSLSITSDGNEKEIGFEFPTDADIMVTGIGTGSEKGEIEWDYNWSLEETYKLMLAVAADSAENFSLYSGYIFLPKENKWKLIGTCRIVGRWTTLKDPAVYFSAGKKAAMNVTTGQVWVQRSNGTWKNLSQSSTGELSPPTINLFGHLDSILQRQVDNRLIDEAIRSGKTDVRQNEQGVFYIMLEEGTGRQVSVNDTVVAHYKGYLFPDGKVFDQTKQNPATFPLKRLIRGWQIGVPLLKTGGKIRLVIPSDLAYSIRTRAAKIPPNSILVFEIEVVDVKPQ